jgi:acyl dehydratase
MDAGLGTETWRVRAVNTSAASANKIHDDAVARTYGFAGGLVPGVDVYAYMTHLPAARWGRAWLEGGTMAARFHRPVYDGDDVVVEARPGGGDESMVLTLRRGGEVCASGVAGLAVGDPETSLDAVPSAVLPAERPPASPATLPVGAVLGTIERGWHADRAVEYLASIGETLELYGGARPVAHPGWLLRSANWVLGDNVRLGPWIHVSSTVTHHGVVGDGDVVVTRGRVVDQFERKGHRFVVLDVLMAAGDRTVLRGEHTAIYEPRPAAG